MDSGTKKVSSTIGHKLMDSHILSVTKLIFCKVLQQIKTGSISVYFPDGSQEVFVGKYIGPCAHLKILNYRCLGKILFGGDIGIAEGYMAGDWTSDNLTDLLKLGVLNKHIFMGVLGDFGGKQKDCFNGHYN